ncbi:ankyrin repeat-containing domain protein [Xylaria palmicola]|nr:ankyrin repeat-containing domain protein [Xylaria palmicola]
MQPPRMMATDLSTRFIQAAEANRTDELQRLIGVEGSPDEETIQRARAAAATYAHVSVINFLFLWYPNIPLNEETIRAAAYSGSEALFSALLSQDASIINRQFDRRGNPLALACMSQRHVEFLEFLLDAGADPNQDPDAVPSPLASVAAFYKDTDAGELLIRHGAKIERSGALLAAAARGNEVMVRFLLDHGARQETDAESAVHVAARRGYVGILKDLLEHGFRSDVKDREGRTASDIVDAAEREEGNNLTEIKELLAKYQ